MILSVWVVCVALMLTACEAVSTFPCATDAQCRRGDVTGTCEASGFCSFLDATCDSGARYDESAGDGLTSKCVPPPTVIPPTDCSSAWFAHTIQLTAGVALPINSTFTDRDPFVTADGLTLYFGSARNGGTGVDIWSASRASVTSEFASPVMVSALDSAVEDTKVSMTQDMLDLTMTSQRNGTVDVFEATRVVATTDFGALSTTTMANVNTFANEYDAALDGDGLRLYLAPDKPAPQHISVATRTTRAAVFAAPIELSELTSGTGDADPALSLDERIIVFTSDRAGSTLGANLWYATRASITVPFETPQPLPGVQTDANEGDAFLTADLCTLYYASAAMGDGNYDLYRATTIGE
jgi:WD40-like Beta Propeller Repeat